MARELGININIASGDELSPGREAIEQANRCAQVPYPEFHYVDGAPATNIGQRNYVGPGRGGRNHPGIDELSSNSER
jgi:hypothetical protein